MSKYSSLRTKNKNMWIKIIISTAVTMMIILSTIIFIHVYSTNNTQNTTIEDISTESSSSNINNTEKFVIHDIKDEISEPSISNSNASKKSGLENSLDRLIELTE